MKPLKLGHPSSKQATAAGDGCGLLDGGFKVRRDADEDRMVVVGELNNAYPDTKAYFRYGESADSQISTGVKQEGEGWSLSASKDIDNKGSGSESLTRRVYHRRFRSKFRFAHEVYYECHYGHNYGDVYERTYPSEWVGGLDGRSQSGTIAVCTGGISAAKGGTFTREDSSAYTWANAANLFGLGLSARSGFSKSVVTKYRFGSDTNKHIICGNHGDSPHSSKRIFSGRGKART